MTISIAVIITTYNRPDALLAVLSGLAQQTDRSFSILVADDGSTEATNKIIHDWQNKNHPLVHVWQEDNGFRAGTIRNKAAAKTTADYLIFIDGDCIPNKNFIAQHRALAESGFFVAGNRILLTEDFTQEVLAKQIALTPWTFKNWWQAKQKKQINRLLPAIYLPLGCLRKLNKKQWKTARTCNLAIWRKDFLAVNGFNEDYEGWGYEDSDLVIRLLRNGIQHKSGRFGTGVAHLWHKENDRSQTLENKQRLETILNNNTVFVSNGVDKYLTI